MNELSADAPVFIVGAPRTGSSFVCEALIRGGGLVGGAEGHILPLLADLDHQIAGYYQLMRNMGMLAIPENTVAQIDEAELRNKVSEVFVSYYEKIYGEGRWVDKTVNIGMIFALPILLKIFPQARVIYLTRHGVRNVLSAAKYFDVSFEEGCRNWSQCSDAWGRMSEMLPLDKVLWIEHEQLLESPTESAGLIANHLSLSAEARKELLRFMVTSACEWRGNTESGITLESSKLTDEQRAAFLEICGEQMVRQGYYSRPELESLCKRYCRSDDHVVRLETAKVLQSEDSIFVEVREGRLYMVPGKAGATIVMFEQLAIAGRDRLSMNIGVDSPYSQWVRLEIIGIDCNNGAVLINGQFELAALDHKAVALEIKPDVREMDLMVRVVQSRKARSNDSGWSYMEDLRVNCSGETACVV